MAVQIPRLTRTQAPQPTSIGRIETQVPDSSRAFNQATSAIANAGDQVMKVFQEKEKQAKENRYDEITQNYHTWYVTQMDGDSKSGTQGLRQWQGDPTEVYNNFDVESDKKRAELLQNLSESDRIEAGRRLNAKHNSLYVNRLAAYGQQYARYENGLADSGVALSQQSAADNMEFVSARDPRSFAPFEQSINDIRDVRVKQAYKNGQATIVTEGDYDVALLDSNGNEVKYKLNSVIKAQLNKDISKPTTEGVETLIKSGLLNEARTMMENYDNQIDPVSKGKLTKMFEQERIQSNAYSAMAELQMANNDKERQKVLNKLEPKTRQKALQLLDSESRYRKNLADRDSEQTYEMLAIRAQDMQAQGMTEEQFQQTGEYKQYYDRIIDPKQRAGLKNVWNKPKDSDPERKARVMDMMVSGDFQGMSYGQFLEETKGLNQRDAAKLETDWKRANNPSSRELESRVNSMSRSFNQFAAGTIVTRDSYGRETKSSIRRRTEMLFDLRTEYEKLPKMSPAETTEWVRQKLTSDIINQKKGKQEKGWFSNLFSSDEPTRPDTKTMNEENKEFEKRRTKWNSLNSQQQQSVRNQFQGANGRAPRDMRELIMWAELND